MSRPSSDILRIVIDLSGDPASRRAALEAVAELSFEQRCLFRVLGDVQKLSYELATLPFEAEFIETVHCEDSASALQRAANAMRDMAPLAMISVNSARAVIASFARAQATLPHVTTPALAAVVPVVKGVGPEATDRYSVVLDVSGQNWAEPTHAKVLVALAGPLVRWFTQREQLRVGVLASDATPGAQDAATQLLLAQLDALPTSVQSLGALTPADVMLGEADIVLASGPSGAMFVRTLEATFVAAEALVHRETQGVRGKLGMRMFRDRLDKLRDYGNIESYGGAPLVGAQGPVIVMRPEASMRAWINAIRMARKMCSDDLIDAQRAALHDEHPHERP